LIGERFLFFFGHAVVRRYVLNDLQRGANAREIAHCHVFGFGHCFGEVLSDDSRCCGSSGAEQAGQGSRGLMVGVLVSVSFNCRINPDASAPHRVSS